MVNGMAEAPSLRLSVLLFLVIAVPLLYYLDVKDFDFVSFDDHLHVCDNPRMEQVSWASILSFWKGPYQHLYIPVSYTAWSLIALISKNTSVKRPFDPAVFHWANLFLHLINTVLVFLLLHKIIGKGWAAFAGSMVFSLHPVQIESVAWISEFRGLLSGSFALATILLVVSEMKNKSDKSLLKNYRGVTRSALFLAGASILFVCALLSKPSAILTPLIAGALACQTKRRRYLLVTVGILVASAFPVIFITGKEQISNMALPLWQRPFLFLDAIGFYTSKILLPISLCVDYGRTPLVVIQNYSWLPMSLLALSTSLLFFLVGKRIPDYIRSLAVFFFAVLPVSGIIPFLFQSFSTVADRYLYLPMVGVALLAASTLAAARRTAAIAVIGGWIIVLAFLGTRQLATWRTSTTLYSRALLTNPKSYLCLNNLGNIFFEKGRYEVALSLYKRAIIKRPDVGEAYYNCARVFNETGNYHAATNFCTRAFSYSPAAVYELLGEIYSREDNTPAAIENFRKALDAGDSSYTVSISMAKLYQRINRRDSAIVYLLSAASKIKCPSELYNNIALQYLFLGEEGKAYRYFSDAISCNPKEIFSRLNRGRLSREAGRYSEAAKDFGDVLRIDATNTFAKAQLYQMTGDSTRRHRPALPQSR